MNPEIRKKESHWWQAFWANYMLLLHAITAVAVTALMLRAVDGRVVNYNTDKPWYRRAHLQADDVTTIVSTAMVCIRIMSVSLAARSAWRCAFILLETKGITLQQFSRMTSWPAYFLGGSTNAYIATAVLLLTLPANLVSPVVTGSVGWRDALKEVPAEPFQHTGPTATDLRWYWYTIGYAAELRSLILSSTSKAGTGWVEFGEKSSRLSRLVTTSQQRMPVNSTVDDLTLPFLEIHSISWDKKSDFKKKITDELPDDWTAPSNITLSRERPFNYYHYGNAILFDENFLEGYTKPGVNETSMLATTPSPVVFSGVKKIVVLVTWQDSSDCSTARETIFGANIAIGPGDLFAARGADVWNCFLIGNVNFTAGVVRRRATFITPRVVEAEVDPAASIEADNWVTESLYLLPDVMVKISLANASQIPTWGNLDGYVGDLIRISYQATWGQVSTQFNAAPLNLTTHELVRGLRATVSQSRVMGWYAAQFLVLVSAALLWVLQGRSNRPTTVDSGVVALLVDPTPVLNEYDEVEELSRMSYVTGYECGTVRLVEREVGRSAGDGQLRGLGHYDPKTIGVDPPVGHEPHGESGAGVANRPTRYMLVPQGVSV